MLSFGLGVVIGAVAAGVIFIVFYKNNLNKINKAREAILKAYAGSKIEEVAVGFDKKLDAAILKIKNGQ